jgi:hypothetical protein
VSMPVVSCGVSYSSPQAAQTWQAEEKGGAQRLECGRSDRSEWEELEVFEMQTSGSGCLHLHSTRKD